MPEPPNEGPAAIQEANRQRWSAADDAWRGYHTRDGVTEWEDRVLETFALLAPRPGASLLDVGCATGVITSEIARRTGASRVVGVDFVAHDTGFEVRPCNLDGREPLPVESGSFDVVICLETLEHVHDTDFLMAELRRVVRPSGYVIVSVPRLDALLAIGMLLVGMQPPAVDCSVRRRYGVADPEARVSGHVSHFTRRALEELAGGSGFRVDAFRQAGIYSGWRFAQGRAAPLWKRLPVRLVDAIPLKKPSQIVRLRPR